MIGKSLLHYEVTARVGAGGMGEVYRATDTKLGRDVAIKVLPPEVAAHEGLLARFRREARVLAALNHPGIASIFGLEEVDGQPFLVMELVPGEDLAQRLRQGPLPVGEAVEIARQLAEGLEVAHEQGIIHRDLKPANIKVDDHGTVKILDFGLAKALELPTDEVETSNSPTEALPVDATREGVVLGTAAYMSPEQARGRPVDKRTDIWAFGCVLYEMLAGRRPFSGERVAELLAAVMKDEPEWASLPSATPPPLRHLLRRCLEKEPRARLRDIGDARLELTPAPSSAEEATDAISGAPSRRAFGVALLLTAIACAAGGAMLAHVFTPGPPEASPARVALRIPSSQRLDTRSTGTPFAWAPDGRRIVYKAREGGDSVPVLFVRELGSFEPRRLIGTEDAVQPTFSPDGEWVAFCRRGMRKVHVDGGRPLAISERPVSCRGVVWSREGAIYVVGDAGLWQVLESGDPDQLLEQPFSHISEASDGRLILSRHYSEEGGVFAYSPEDGRLEKIYDGRAASAHVLPTGHLVFGDAEEIRAIRIDPVTLRVRGEAMTAVAPVYVGLGGFGNFAVSEIGTLAYTTGESLYQLVSVGPGGDVRSLEGLSGERGIYWYPELSPDGTRALVTRVVNQGFDVWVYDLEGATWLRLTATGDSYKAVWTPDGQWLTIVSATGGLVHVSGDGTRSETLIPRVGVRPMAWSPDGRVLATSVPGPAGTDIWLWSRSSDAPVFPNTDANESAARFSPDGRYLAYVSDESGERDVYVRSYPDLERKWPISSGGGREPVWSTDGTKLYYRRGDEMIQVQLELRDDVRIVSRDVLFSGSYDQNRADAAFDVGEDGRFLMSRFTEDAIPDELQLVLDWTAELERLLPPD